MLLLHGRPRRRRGLHRHFFQPRHSVHHRSCGCWGLRAWVLWGWRVCHLLRRHPCCCRWRRRWRRHRWQWRLSWSAWRSCGEWRFWWLLWLNWWDAVQRRRGRAKRVRWPQRRICVYVCGHWRQRGQRLQARRQLDRRRLRVGPRRWGDVRPVLWRGRGRWRAVRWWRRRVLRLERRLWVWRRRRRWVVIRERNVRRNVHGRVANTRGDARQRGAC